MKKTSRVLLFLFIGPALTYAQSPLTGTWQNEVLSGGSLQLWTVELIQDGTSLTGTVEPGSNDAAEIYEGEIRGDAIVFKVNIPGHRTITFSGEIDGDEIAFTRDVEVREGGNPGGTGIFGSRAVPQFTAKRVPDGQVPARPKGTPFLKQLTVFDRQGNVVRALGEPRLYTQPMLSPDGARLAVFLRNDIWVFDLSTGNGTQVTSSAQIAEYQSSPVWSPDGSQITFFSFRENYGGLYRKASNGTGSEELLYRHTLGVDIPPTDWSPDGRFLSFSAGAVLWTLPLNGERKAMELSREEFDLFGARYSPDGRFLAYVSDETGRNEVYVRPVDPSSGFSPGGGKWQVSHQGGLGLVQWRWDGRELYYLAADGGVMAVDVSTTPAFEAGPSKLLFRAPSTFLLTSPFSRQGTNAPDCSCAIRGCEQGSISRDGQRFVFAVPMPPEREEVTVAPEILAKYVGTYVMAEEAGFDAGINVTVTLEGNQLMIQYPFAQEKFLLFAESETYFSLKVTNGDFEFVKNDSGNVTHFIEYVGGSGIRAIRK